MKLFYPVFNKHLVIALAMSLLIGCDMKEEPEAPEMTEETDTIKSSVINVAGELFSVPSPLQTALLIQRSGITYEKAVLSNANLVNTFNTDISKALNLGVYGADLGYVSLYNQTQDALRYLTSIKTLSDELGISSAFDAATLERIQKNITNKDSMMTLVGIAYRASDAYLKDNRRNDIGGLILAGGWVESMHFSITAYRKKPNDQIRYRIAEQKQALSSIIKILTNNEAEEVKQLVTSLGALAQVYEGIQFKYNFVEPTHDTVKKVTYINSTTEVVVTDEQLSQISEKIREIRDRIITTTSTTKS